MVTWKKLTVAATTLAVALDSGYLSAWHSLSACADATYQELQRLGINGTDIRGNKVPLSRSNLPARVTGPFLVEVQYLVPHDLHGILYVNRYIALPWRTTRRSSEVVQLVAASIIPSQLSQQFIQADAASRRGLS